MKACLFGIRKKSSVVKYIQVYISLKLLWQNITLHKKVKQNVLKVLAKSE